MAKRRVAITGIGTICALGNDTDKFWQTLAAGHTAIAPITSLPIEHLRFRNGAEVKDFDPAQHFDPKRLDLLDRFTQLALVAARAAVASAGLDSSLPLGERAGVMVGSAMGGQISEDHSYAKLYRDGKRRFSPFTILRIMSNAATSHISMEFGITGPSLTFSTACSSATHAIGYGFWLVRQGLADIVIVGGSETPFTLGHLQAWDALRVVSPDTCRPFSQGRKGMILGEGAAMLVLESLEHARARGVPVLAEVIGFGMSSDANDLTQPSAQGAAQALKACLDDGRLSPSVIDYINAHGTGTLRNDATETAAIRRVFGSYAERLVISSTKSAHGHLLGAAGAIEATATVLALQHSVIPPTVNFLAPDPQCDLDVVVNSARPLAIEVALSNSFAFGGLNAVLAFARCLSITRDV